MIREHAPAKLNLVLHVGTRRSDGLHELCSLFASIDLADELTISEASGGGDTVVSPGVTEPDLCASALAAFRAAATGADLPPLEIAVRKRIPIAAGLGGGSADAAAVLRAANRLAGEPFGEDELRRLAAGIGADVPSQVRPGHALVRGFGELVEPVTLPALRLVLAPQGRGLATAEVYREADRIGAVRQQLDPDAVRALPDRPLDELAASLENDLQPAALALRPELGEPIAALRRAGAMAALLTGSGPTAFGVFEDDAAARRAAASIPGAIVAGTR